MSKSNKTLYLPVLALPNEFRQDLSVPQGTLIVHPDRGKVVNLEVDVTIGDIVSKNHVSFLKIVDFKTKRTHEIDVQERCRFVVVNPPGTISLNGLTIVNNARQGYICVIGEEDLLVLALLRQENKSLLYGQPDVGVVLLRTRREISIKAFKILKPTMVKYNT